MIRVGRCTYDKTGTMIYPSIDGYENVVVLMKSSPYYELSPYYLTNSDGIIMENKWQFSKVYPKVPYSKQYYSKYDKTVIWEYKEETHIDNYDPEKKGENDNIPNEKYYEWRKKGFKNKYAVRYPVGFNNRGDCVYALVDNKKLGYIEARKAIYIPEYCKLVKNELKFKLLKNKLRKGQNLLIIEVDGPHYESLFHYMTKYGVGKDFIVNNTMLVNENNIKIMLNDDKHNFGHGYCLAMALLDKDKEWINGNPDVVAVKPNDEVSKMKAIDKAISNRNYELVQKIQSSNITKKVTKDKSIDSIYNDNIIISKSAIKKLSKKK